MKQRLRLAVVLLLLCLVLLLALNRIEGRRTAELRTGEGRATPIPELGQAPQLLPDQSLAGPFALVPSAPRSGGLTVDTLHRESSTAFFFAYYLPCEGTPTGWTGSHAACDAGGTSEAFRTAILQRINYFRAMAGVPADITFDEALNGKAQKAALMVSANGRLSHAPDASWRCYSLEGALGARSSNLYLEVHSCTAIDGYMQDAGSGNEHVPHRRWLLNPRTLTMGIGDIPPSSGHPAANALWVFGAASAERPKTRDN
ncbi:MAG: CAP domain-containing protein, partial [Chloroflexi bacterium]|nr:CAP domain-containing protein [Chloroflexota bacterium]